MEQNKYKIFAKYNKHITKAKDCISQLEALCRKYTNENLFIYDRDGYGLVVVIEGEDFPIHIEIETFLSKGEYNFKLDINDLNKIAI